jgi:hypothetical protein
MNFQGRDTKRYQITRGSGSIFKDIASVENLVHSEKNWRPFDNQHSKTGGRRQHCPQGKGGTVALPSKSGPQGRILENMAPDAFDIEQQNEGAFPRNVHKSQGPQARQTRACSQQGRQRTDGHGRKADEFDRTVNQEFQIRSFELQTGGRAGGVAGRQAQDVFNPGLAARPRQARQTANMARLDPYAPTTGRKQDDIKRFAQRVGRIHACHPSSLT